MIKVNLKEITSFTITSNVRANQRQANQLSKRVSFISNLLLIFLINLIDRLIVVNRLVCNLNLFEKKLG